MISLSYAITVCNEGKELDFLLNKLMSGGILPEDEVVILVDIDNTTVEVARVIERFKTISNDINLKVITGHLNKDFAAFKNELKKACTKDFIFFIDADEYPSQELLDSLRTLLLYNQLDILSVPRVNIVNGLTPEHIAKWGWTVNEKGWVNWPDYQTRVCRNAPEIEWKGKVHEKLSGWLISSSLPADNETWALYHIKDIERQERQNDFYSKI